jgi:hypothetical protein
MGPIKTLRIEPLSADPEHCPTLVEREVTHACHCATPALPLGTLVDHALSGNEEAFQDELESWKEEARRFAIGSYRLILEDGPDLSDSSDRTDELTNMYASGCQSPQAARLSEAQARLMCLHGRGGDLGNNNK